MPEDILKNIVEKITSLDWNLKTVDGKPHPFIDLLNETPFSGLEKITFDYGTWDFEKDGPLGVIEIGPEEAKMKWFQVRLNGKPLKNDFTLTSTHRKMQVEKTSLTLTIPLTEDEYYKVFQLFDNLLGRNNFDVIIKQR